VKPVLTALGVDYAQWKALTIAALKLDMRASTFGGARTKRRRSGVTAIIGQIVFYILLGLFMALFVSYMGDRFAAAIVVYSYVIVMVGTAMLVDHNTAIVSPTDYGILGFQPITSRTYFASKLTNVLVYTLAMTTALGLLPVVALAVKYGIAVGLLAVLALYVCATTVTLAIVVGYASLVRRVGAARLKSLLAYVQLLTGFLVYGGYFLTSEFVSRSALSGFHLNRTPWLMLYPATWFASYLEVAAGSAAAVDLVPALASVALLGFLMTRLRGRLSLEYAERLGAMAAEPPATGSGSRGLKPGIWFRGGEARAVAILVRSHFRNDIKFRMGVIGIVPLTVLYLIMGLRGNGDGSSGGNLSMVTMAVLLFPMLLKANLGRSDAFRASWIFFASPVDRTRLIRSAKNVLVVLFLVPYLVFVGLTLTLFTRDPYYVAVYLLLVGLVSHVALVIATLADPEMPFSKPPERTRGSSRIIVTMMVVGVIGALLPLFSRLVYASAPATVAVFAAVLCATLALNRLTRVRIERQAAHLEFDG